MPIYEYRCASCGAVFARLQSMSVEDRSMPCPSCKGDQTERLLSSFATGTSASGPGTGGGAAIGSPACGGGGG